MKAISVVSVGIMLVLIMVTQDHEVHNISDNESTDYDENFNFSD